LVPFKDQTKGGSKVDHGVGFKAKIIYAPKGQVTVVGLSDVKSNESGLLARKLMATAVGATSAP
jgi:hypothetical protein